LRAGFFDGVCYDRYDCDREHADAEDSSPVPHG